MISVTPLTALILDPYDFASPIFIGFAFRPPGDLDQKFS
jgi:hypothetical protein